MKKKIYKTPLMSKWSKQESTELNKTQQTRYVIDKQLQKALIKSKKANHIYEQNSTKLNGICKNQFAFLVSDQLITQKQSQLTNIDELFSDINILRSRYNELLEIECKLIYEGCKNNNFSSWFRYISQLILLNK